jgi:hypothetical protein
MDRFERIAARIANPAHFASEYEASLDGYVGKLNEALKLLEPIHRQTSSPEGKAIVMGMHSDLFNFIGGRENGVRGWVEKLKFMSRAKKKPSNE